MEELKALLENVSDSYYDFVRAMLQSAKEHYDRIDEIIAYIKDNPEANTSDILGWDSATFDGIDFEKPVSIVNEDDEEEECNCIWRPLFKGGFLIPVCNRLHLTWTQTLQNSRLLWSSVQIRSKLNNFTAPRGRYFYTQKQFIPNVVGNERSGRRKDRNMNNRRIFIGLQHFAEGEGDGGFS